MRSFKRYVTYLVCISFICSEGAYAVVPFYHNNNYYTTEVPSNFSVGNTYYSADIDGVGEYMDSLQIKNPKAYNALLDTYENLKTKRIVGMATMAGSVAVGFLLVVGSFTFLEKSEYNGSYETKTSNSPAFYGGGAIAVVGFLLGRFLLPSRTDYLKFVNKNNAINPESPLEWKIGFSDVTGNQGYSGAVSFRF